jgi:diguanylate cyclase (GGDEF)-like protein
MRSDLVSKLESCTTLPSLPAAAVEVLRLCEKPHIDLARMAELISSDPALCAKILRWVNSPAFGLRREILSISQALVLLGVNSVRALVLSLSLPRQTSGKGGSVMTTSWRRSITAAVVARELASRVLPEFREECFLAALLQDIGMLALLRVDGPAYETLVSEARNHDSLCRAEVATYGVDHAAIGAWLARRWGIPEPLVLGVSGSHAPPRRPGDLAPPDVRLAEVVAVSGPIADIWCDREPAEALERAQLAAGSAFGDTIDLPAVLHSVGTALETVGRLFEVDVATAEEAAEILERSREILVSTTLHAAQQVDSAWETIRELEQRANCFREQSMKDAMTGLANREHGDGFLAEMFARGEGALPLSVIFADVDFFKCINDTHGHATGDAVLKAIARILVTSSRERDLVARFGGEEFVVVLANTDLEAARAVAERIRSRVATNRLQFDDGRSVSVTLSCGVATYVPWNFATPSDLLKAADEALYAAKRAGRNRVVAAGDATVALRRLTAAGAGEAPPQANAPRRAG